MCLILGKLYIAPSLKNCECQLQGELLLFLEAMSSSEENWNNFDER